MPSLSKPVLATYVEPRGRKGIDLLDLCRRLLGEYQYMDPKPAGQLVSVEPNVPIDESNFSEVTDALININRMNPFWKAPPRAAFRKALQCKTFTRITLSSNFGSESEGPQITGKNFYAKGDLSKKQIERWFWTLKLRWTCSIINQAVSHMIPELKRRGYSGFILPHGKMVSFESLHFALIEVVPRDYVLFHYKLPPPAKTLMMLMKTMGGGVNQGLFEPTTIEQTLRVDGNEGVITQHTVLAFNLPSENDRDEGRLFVVDPTGAQFRAWESSGGLMNWGFYEDFEKSFPADMVLTGFEPHNYVDPTFFGNGHGPTLLNSVVKNLLLPSCSFCGDVEKGSKRSVNLKMCSRCKKVTYCDSTCQKLAWSSHKSNCHSGD